jgi:type IV pilus assembly protein PilO
MPVVDFLAHLPRMQQLLLGLLAVAALGAIGYFLVISPNLAELDSLQQRQDALTAEVAKARREEAGLRRFQIEVEALRKRLETARGRLPTEREIPTLYRQITDLASQSGLSVALFAPRPMEERDTYREIPISLTAEGSYHQIGEFFEQLGRLPHIVATNELRLVGIDRPTGSVRAELALATYLSRPDAPMSSARTARASVPATSGATPLPRGR